MAAKKTTTIRVSSEIRKRGKKALLTCKGARIGSFDWTHKKPTMDDLFTLGVELAESLQKGALSHV